MKSLINFSLSFLFSLATIFTAHAGEKITYIHNDALGSPVAATNQLGQVIWRETYKPHGQRTTNAAASANNKTWFTGKQEEAALGINYFGARWYHPVQKITFKLLSYSAARISCSIFCGVEASMARAVIQLDAVSRHFADFYFRTW